MRPRNFLRVLSDSGLGWFRISIGATVARPSVCILLAAWAVTIKTMYGVDQFAQSDVPFGWIRLAHFIVYAVFLSCAVVYSIVRDFGGDQRESLQFGVGVNSRSKEKAIAVAADVASLACSLVIAEAWLSGLQTWPAAAAQFVGVLALRVAAAMVFSEHAGSTTVPDHASTKVLRLSLGTIVVALALLSTVMSGFLATDAVLARQLGPATLLASATTFWIAVAICVIVTFKRSRACRWAFTCFLVYLIVCLYHYVDVDTLPRHNDLSKTATPSVVAQSFETHFLNWLENYAKDNQGVDRLKVVLVAAEGGGQRAAFWTAKSIQQLEANTVYAYSGVSGGSVGIVIGLATKTLPGKNRKETEAIIDQYFLVDQVSPLIARLAFVEPLRLVLPGFLAPRGREENFEAQLSDTWRAVTGNNFLAEPFSVAFGANTNGISNPLVIFNTTWIEKGSQVAINNVHEDTVNSDTLSGPRAKSLFWSNSFGALKVIEAAHLSARFPLISGAAQIVSKECVTYPLDGICNRYKLASYVDGGFSDNSGLLPIAEIYSGIIALRRRAVDKDASLKRHWEILGKLDVHIYALTNESTFHNQALGAAEGAFLSNTFSTMNAIRAGRSEISWQAINDLVERQNNASGAAVSSKIEGMSDIEKANYMNVHLRHDTLTKANLGYYSVGRSMTTKPCHFITEKFPALGWSLSAKSHELIRCASWNRWRAHGVGFNFFPETDDSVKPYGKGFVNR